MLPWKLRKRQNLPVIKNLSSVYFSLTKFEFVSCNLSLPMIWQMTYTHKLPKLCLATLKCPYLQGLTEVSLFYISYGYLIRFSLYPVNTNTERVIQSVFFARCPH